MPSSNQILFHKAGHVCGDDNDLIGGQPTGSVRISFGYMSTKKDADHFLNMIQNCFVQQPLVRKWPERNSNHSIGEINEMANNIDRKTINSVATLEKIFLYPIKSCGVFVVPTKWLLTSTGLKYDRHWMIVNSSGVCITQKRNKNLCLIRPKIDLKRNTLNLEFPGTHNLRL